MESTGNKEREEEFGQILENYAQFLNIHVRKYDLQKYGLDPEDILQDVRIKLWKLINDERTIFNHGSYLKKVINSSVIDHLRKARREDLLVRREKQKHIAEIGRSYSKEAAHKRIFEEMVGRAVSRLIDSRRQVVKLYLLNFSVQDISSYMNWSVDRTRNLLYRGLADLRKSLKALETENEVRK
jgi:RNA polymerase sigma-70 factor, ECF subfamily